MVDHNSPPKVPLATTQRRGRGWLVFLLVSLFLLTGVALACGGGLYWGSSLLRKNLTTDFVPKTYEMRIGQVLRVRNGNAPLKPTVFICQVVKLEGDFDTDLAAAAQVAEISGTINGDFDFKGQVLYVKKGAHVTGDIRVAAAQVVKIDGRVDGQITGTYQVLHDRRPTTEADDATEAAQFEVGAAE